MYKLVQHKHFDSYYKCMVTVPCNICNKNITDIQILNIVQNYKNTKIDGYIVANVCSEECYYTWLLAKGIDNQK